MLLCYKMKDFSTLVWLLCVPEDWKRVVVTPIKRVTNLFLKITDPFRWPAFPEKLSNTLLILSSMSKCFSNNDIKIPHQHGFRKGFSTLTQLITVLDDWFSSLDRRTRSNVLLLDRPFALRGHVRSFLWKWKLHDFAFEKRFVGHILNKIIAIWFFKPAPFS